MKSLGKQILAYLLLLCIAVSAFPWDILHHHEEEISCENLEEDLENDLCHQKIFHTNELQDNHCDHQTHIDREQDHCEFCKFITSRHNNYVVPQIFTFHEIDVVEKNGYSEPFFSTNFTSDVIYNRGPPAYCG